MRRPARSLEHLPKSPGTWRVEDDQLRVESDAGQGKYLNWWPSSRHVTAGPADHGWRQTRCTSTWPARHPEKIFSSRGYLVAAEPWIAAVSLTSPTSEQRGAKEQTAVAWLGLEVDMGAKEERGRSGEEEAEAEAVVAGEGEVEEEEMVLPNMSVRVLLVEGDDSTRQIIAALLRKCGYRGSFLLLPLLRLIL